MRFIDSNLFIYALLKPKRRLTELEATMKRRAKEIISRIDANENVITTVIHISEILNILESHASYEYVVEVAERLFANDNIIIKSVMREDYLTSLELAKEYKIGINDGLALLFMQKNKLHEIYTFDKHFDQINGISRVT